LPLQLTGQWLGAHLDDSHPQARHALADDVAWPTTSPGLPW